MSTRQEIDEAVAIALEAGQTALGYFQQSGIRTDVKPDDSLLSEADASTEELIINRLQKSFPGQPVIGEESISEQDVGHFENALNSASAWVVDPIDGTNNFVAGDPAWCVSIARLNHGRPELGVIYFPALGDQLYFNEGETLHTKRLATSPDSQLEAIPLALPDEYPARLFMAHDSFYLRFKFRQRHVPRISGCTVMNLLYVVLGKAIAAATSAHLWDFAAPLAFAPPKNIQMAAIFSERAYDRFTPDDLHLTPENPKRAWKVKEECIVAPASLIDELRDSITTI